MNKTVLISFLVAMLAVAACTGAQVAARASGRDITGVDPAWVVSECLETASRNVGGWCGTPYAEAHQRLSEIGKPAVPHLVEGLRSGDWTEIDQFIAGALSAICCYTFQAGSHDALLVEVEGWWRIHCDQTEPEWILDALGSGDSRRMGYAYRRAERLTSRQDMDRLTSFLGSENKDIVSAALRILWANFQSEHALRYVREVCRSGTKDQRMLALRFCETEKIKSLTPAVAEVLRKESDYQVIAVALDAARQMGASDCTPFIEKMERAPSSKYPKHCVIRALAALKTTAYADRVLYYLRSGDRSERMAAAEVITHCISPENAISPLLPVLQDPDPNVRRHACISLGRSASDKSVRDRFDEVVPQLIQLLREEDGSDFGSLPHQALERICVAHFGYDALPKVDGNLGGSEFSGHALPIWEKWWDSHGR